MNCEKSCVELHHMDGNKANNHIANFALVTPVMDSEFAHEHQLHMPTTKYSPTHILIVEKGVNVYYPIGKMN